MMLTLKPEISWGAEKLEVFFNPLIWSFNVKFPLIDCKNVVSLKNFQNSARSILISGELRQEVSLETKLSQETTIPSSPYQWGQLTN